MAEKQLT